MKKFRVVVAKNNPVSFSAWNRGTMISPEHLVSDEVMTLEKLEEFSKKYIGSVFKDEEDTKRNMEYIQKVGEECWLTDDYTDIFIKEVK